MSRDLRDAFGCFATGVTLVTTHWNGQDYGMTCSSFNAVSLDPALVLWNIRHNATSHEAFVRGGGYTVSVLGSEHKELAQAFARGTQAERFAAAKFSRRKSGRLQLVHALAWFDCTLQQAVTAGDHDILIGQVDQYGSRAGKGLVFERGQFAVDTLTVGAAASSPF
ncbi:NADH-FMN oxidoreductase RutF, flavin reductase (DIM6/NTAB) family [Rhodoferax sp. OV413]|uniref:flavin reductase family protein n=1 Tax=Rhodoferax sp. OV413 TaxID=1855285 RepID=UPI00088D72BE|nr:flavin reductase family protein [Rhodoferax sp. OV413]SDP91698.1 NADH-FMN oxidoreductase RutF, flavin reductase (DIM6/NTAB) family [Rhodoferax sp. OV413]